jgi:hypothetical protein
MQLGIFVHVLQHSSASALAVVELAGAVPALLCMPFAGTAADRYDVRGLAVASMLAQAAAVFGMVMLGGAARVWAVAGLYGIQGAAGTLWPSAMQRWLYGVVPSAGWPAANAAIGSVSGVMTMAGAALGGVLSAWSTTAALCAAAGVQIAAVLPLLAVARLGHGAAAPARQTLRADLAEGVAALRGLPLARSVIWIGVAWGLVGGAYNVLLAAHVTRDLRGGGLLLGAFYVVDGIAVILGSAAAARLSTSWHLRCYALAYVVQGGAWGAMFIPRQPALGIMLLAVMRVASGVIIALDTTILLATVPGHLRGRVTSLHMATYGAVSRISLAMFGGFLTAAGPTLTGVAAGAASVLVGTTWWIINGGRSQTLYTGTSPGQGQAPGSCLEES